MGTAIFAFLKLYIVYRQKNKKSITFVDFSNKYQGKSAFSNRLTVNYMRKNQDYARRGVFMAKHPLAAKVRMDAKGSLCHPHGQCGNG